MFRYFLSWRYLTARRTNWIGIAGIFVGVGALIMILSIMTGFLDEHRRVIRGSLADLMVSPYHFKRSDGRLPPLEPAPMLEIVRADPRVASASAQLQWWGLLVRGGRAAAEDELMLSNPRMNGLPIITMLGVDLEDEFKTTELAESLRRVPELADDGRLQRVADPEHPFEPPPEFTSEKRPLRAILLGIALMDALRLERGDVVELRTFVPKGGEDGVKSNRRYVVGGAVQSRENDMDLERVYLERSELKDLMSSERGFSTLVIKLNDYERDGAAVKRDLFAKLDAAGLIKGQRDALGQPYEVLTWEEFRAPLIKAIENERVMIGIMLALVLLVAGFTVYAILSMMVVEKRRDIGILTALGATRTGVLATFLLIAFWDALIGATGGALAGTYLALHVDGIEHGLSRGLSAAASWISGLFGGDPVLVQIFNREIYLFDHIPSRVIPISVAAIVLGAFVCTLLFAALPAWRAARMDPLEALRHE